MVFSNPSIRKFGNSRIASKRREQGYILLVLLLFLAVLSISMLAAVRKMDFQVRRDREEEMIHRGVQYSRAVRRYFKKFGRYPTRVEELENSNNIRFLRKRYKDPMHRDPKTGKELDFKLLHMQDVQTSFNSAPVAGMVSASNLADADPALSNTEVQAGAPGALNASAAGPSGRGPGSIGGAQNQPSAGNNASNDQSESQPDQAGGQGTPPPPQPLVQQLGANGAPQVFGGGGIVGVASLNKDKTIRVFNKKDHYNQWQFIYDPTTDRGGLLMTPNQPPLMNAAQNVNQQQNGQSGISGSGPNGGNSGFASPGMGLNPGGMNPPNNNSPNNNQPPQPNLPPDQNQ